MRTTNNKFKLILTTALAMISIISCIIASASSNVLIGDVDQDGKLSIKDATVIQKHIAKIKTLSEAILDYADINNDNHVNIKDATYIQKLIAKINLESTSSAATQSTTRPIITQPATTRPIITQPATTRPIATQPVTIKPIATQPATTKPITTQPATTKPITTQPITTRPIITQPATTKPIITQPATTKPIATQPATTKPKATDPLEGIPGGGVWIATESGKKYHYRDCRSLSRSDPDTLLELTVSEALKMGYTACGICKPPIN